MQREQSLNFLEIDGSFGTKSWEELLSSVWSTFGLLLIAWNMDAIVAPIDDSQIFEIEEILEKQIGLKPLSFPMMDKSSAATCNFFRQNKRCHLDRLCPYRHARYERNVVCKHWLRGLCKKGDDCDFLHIYDRSRMPECYFHSVLNSCTNKECNFVHIHRDSSRINQECSWYNRGFCRRGNQCRLQHVRRTICPRYLTGFCPYGSRCQFFHGKFFVHYSEFQKMLWSFIYGQIIKIHFMRNCFDRNKNC